SLPRIIAARGLLPRPVMMRITQVLDGETATRLRVEGRIAGHDGGALRAACEPHLAAPGALVLDLAEVSFVDAAGASALRDLERRGALLVGRSGFVAQLLQAVAVPWARPGDGGA